MKGLRQQIHQDFREQATVLRSLDARRRARAGMVGGPQCDRGPARRSYRGEPLTATLAEIWQVKQMLERDRREFAERAA